MAIWPATIRPNTNQNADVENGGLGDGLVNLLEFALGGDPTVDDAAAVLPLGTVVESGGSNVLSYVYRRRTDVTNLTYGLVLESNLVLGEWTNHVGTAYEVAPTGGTEDPDIESVTNLVPTVDAVKFIRLEVEETL